MGVISPAWGAHGGSHIIFNLIVDHTLIICDPYGIQTDAKKDKYQSIKEVSQALGVKRVVMMSNRLQHDEHKTEESCGILSTALAEKMFSVGVKSIREWLKQPKKKKNTCGLVYEERDLTALLGNGDDVLSCLVSTHEQEEGDYDAHIQALREQHQRQRVSDVSQPQRVFQVWAIRMSLDQDENITFEQVFKEDQEFPRLLLSKEDESKTVSSQRTRDSVNLPKEDSRVDESLLEPDSSESFPPRVQKSRTTVVRPGESKKLSLDSASLVAPGRHSTSSMTGSQISSLPPPSQSLFSFNFSSISDSQPLRLPSYSPLTGKTPRSTFKTSFDPVRTVPRESSQSSRKSLTQAEGVMRLPRTSHSPDLLTNRSPALFGRGWGQSVPAPQASSLPPAPISIPVSQSQGGISQTGRKEPQRK